MKSIPRDSDEDGTESFQVVTNKKRRSKFVVWKSTVLCPLLTVRFYWLLLCDILVLTITELYLGEGLLVVLLHHQAQTAIGGWYGRVRFETLCILQQVVTAILAHWRQASYINKNRCNVPKIVKLSTVGYSVMSWTLIQWIWNSVVRYPRYLDTYRRYLRDDTSIAEVMIYRGIS